MDPSKSSWATARALRVEVGSGFVRLCRVTACRQSSSEPELLYAKYATKWHSISTEQHAA